MVKEFYKINKTAAYLNIPYILWLIFAMILSYNVYLLNMQFTKIVKNDIIHLKSEEKEE